MPVKGFLGQGDWVEPEEAPSGRDSGAEGAPVELKDEEIILRDMPGWVPAGPRSSLAAPPETAQTDAASPDLRTIKKKLGIGNPSAADAVVGMVGTQRSASTTRLVPIRLASERGRDVTKEEKIAVIEDGKVTGVQG